MLQGISKDNFNQLLGNFSTSELENLIEKFPYFHQAHVLLAKKYQTENNPKFDEQLQLAVLYTQDRELLFSLFNERDVESLIQPIEYAVKEEETAKTFEETHLIEETQISNTLKEVLNVIPEPTVEQEESVVLKEEEKETFITSEQHTFDEWLQAYNKPETLKVELGQELIPLEPEKQDEELNKLIQSNLPLQELVEEETHYSKGLETFIEEQIQKHKYVEVKAPVSETELAPELITETIAKVYEKQKKYPKAIRAYEILTLKYPEKNDFFAARIIELKNKL